MGFCERGVELVRLSDLWIQTSDLRTTQLSEYYKKKDIAT
jgi:hypothetical protein